MSKAEFQKLHDEMKALKTAGKHEEFGKKFTTKDAIFMGPLHEPCGAAGAAKMMADPKMAAIMKADFKVTLDEITQIGEIVIDRSTIVVQGPTGEKTGWNLTVWVKEDGQWKIRSSCTTFKAPIPPQ